jgi:hypothetical protein
MSPDSYGASACVATCAERVRAFSSVIGFPVALVLVALAVPNAYGQSQYGEPKDVPIDELKRAYLSCSGAALSGRLSGGEIMACSLVYEELKRRAFGGDFHKLLAWSKTQPPAQRAE